MSTAGPPAAVAASPVDARLVPAALLAWAATLVALLAGWVTATVLSVLGVLALGLVLRRRGGWVPAVAAGLAVLVLFGAGAALRVHATQAHPLHDAAERGATVRVEAELTDDPTALRGGVPGAAQVLVRADLDTVTVRGARTAVGGAVVLLAPEQGWARLSPGQRVAVSAEVAPPRRADLTVASLRVDEAPVLLGGPPWYQRAAGVLRTGLREAAARVLPAEQAGLLPGLVVGDTSGQSAELTADFRTAGLTHLTAVSGTNITIVCAAVLGLVLLAGAGPRTAAVLAGVALVAFVVLARPSPSVLRAAVMGAIGLLALVTARRRQAVPALCTAVVALLAVSPALAVDAGFALSVLATGALVLLAPGWAAALKERGVPPGVAELLVVPVAAHVVTAPVIAGLSAQLSLVAVLANLLAAPAVGVATVLGVLATVVLPVWTPAGEVLLRAAGPAVWWLVTVATRCAALPDAAVAVPGGVAGALGMAAVTVAVLVAVRRPAVRALVLAVVVGVALVWVPTRVLTPGWPAPGWALVSCDVGQGDATVLSLGAGRAVLVDAGPDPRAVDGCLDHLGVTSLALVVLTHLHADHVDGLAGALAGRAVGAVALGPLHLPEDTLGQVRAAADAAGAPLVDLAAGARLAWPGLVLDVLAPLTPPPRRLGSDPGTELNESSLVLAASTTLGRVLLTGDVELGAQAALLRSGADLRADVLKVPHHGSRYSDPAFLDAVHPRLALVSVGAGNTYGHPSAGVLERLAGAGALVERTDQQGDVAVRPGPDGPVVVARGHPGPG